MAGFDLVIGDAVLRNRPGRHSIGITGGRIAAIEAGSLRGRREVDADGNLVTESFVNAHLHLCKVYTLNRVGDAALAAYTGGSMGAAMTAIELAATVKEQYDESWIEPNARRAVLEAVRHGIRHMLAFADVDTKARLHGIRPLLKLRDEFRGIVDLQVVAFPQDGLLRDPGAEDLVREAVELGADVVGGIPWIEHSDEDAREHVRKMCSLAVEHGRRVAMLVDDAGDPALRTTEMLATEMIRQGLTGRGIANHARAVGTYAEPSVRLLAGLARRAGLGFVTDPHTGPVRLPAFLMAELGVPVALGQDDIEDAYYPFGRNNMLEVAFLAAHALEAVSKPAMDRIYDMVTAVAADVLGVEDHRLEVDAPADLVVLDGSSVHDVLTRHNPPRYVIASGRLVAESTAATTFHY
ncbi:MAG TPA: amidohydrolase family protein [Jiangellaceae bacterium]